MSGSRSITIAASLVLMVGMACSVLLLLGADRMRGAATLEEVLYVSSPKVLKRLSFGYDGLLADIYWTRTVQYFGGKHQLGARRYDLLAPLLEITTTLDPQLFPAYEYGANFLSAPPPGGAGDPAAAVALIKEGIAHNPQEWKLYYDLGFVYFMDLKDYGAAAKAFADGAELPNAHPWMKIMAAQMATRADDSQTAAMMWTATYQTSRDGNIRANAAAHLRALQADADVTALDSTVGRYRELTGHLPASFSDLQSSGMLRGTPVDPLGRPYRLTADGSVLVRDPDDLPFLTKGLPSGYTPPAAPKILPTD
jgi:hypothetical protein